jgi:hypothetical protein
MKLQLVTLVALSLVGCGSSDSGSTSSGGQEEVEAKVSIQGPEGFSLLASASFSDAEVKGCISQRHLTGLTHSNTSIKLLVGDANCKYQLNSVAIEGETFDLSRFDFAQGTRIVTQGEDGRALQVKVTSQLPAVITSTAPQVAMSMSFLDFSNNNNARLSTSDAGVDLKVDAPIDLEIAVGSAQIDSDTGAVAATFEFQCESAVADGICNGHDLGAIKIAMAGQSSTTHLFNDASSAQQKLDECKALASTGAAPASVKDENEHVTLPQGGAISAEMIGPGPAFASAANRELVLAIIAGDSASDQSCKFYKVSVSL